ncbi:hypothetical protein THAOC_00272 [Thalassiosira oceanica]|uniref:Uncharacterized protein n=1 Tax=Thalassiosira oceanica TaxID=159749 RepID=K0TRI7_THAOC|nr:hypothetical protein THAOC_00272 [Thalassiosira oceanica]|eukprot:EJK77867.1 hypothetical protein THAOC_00272 [Thalassiosira oceanica]
MKPPDPETPQLSCCAVLTVLLEQQAAQSSGSGSSSRLPHPVIKNQGITLIANWKKMRKNGRLSINLRIIRRTTQPGPGCCRPPFQKADDGYH